MAFLSSSGSLAYNDWTCFGLEILSSTMKLIIAKRFVRDFWRVVEVYYAWMDGVVPNDTAKIQGLLDFHRQSLGD